MTAARKDILLENDSDILDESIAIISEVITSLSKIEQNKNLMTKGNLKTIQDGINSIKGALGATDKNEEFAYIQHIDSIFNQYSSKSIPSNLLDLLIKSFDSLRLKLSSKEHSELLNIKKCHECVVKYGDNLNCQSEKRVKFKCDDSQDCYAEVNYANSYKLYNCESLSECQYILITEFPDQAIEMYLEKNNIPYATFDCTEKVYKFMSELKSVQAFFIDDIVKDIEFHHFIRVISKVKPNINHYVLMKSGKVPFYHHEDFDDICFHALGAKSDKLKAKIELLLSVA